MSDPIHRGCRVAARLLKLDAGTCCDSCHEDVEHGFQLETIEVTTCTGREVILHVCCELLRAHEASQ